MNLLTIYLRLRTGGERIKGNPDYQTRKECEERNVDFGYCRVTYGGCCVLAEF